MWLADICRGHGMGRQSRAWSHKTRPWALTHCPRSSTQVPQILAMADTVQALLCVVKTEPLHRGTLPTLWPRCLVDI